MSTDAVDEFSFLSDQLDRLGLPGPVPPVGRLTLETPSGTRLSALRWGDEQPRVTLLHGAGLNAHTWDATLLALGLPALAIDLPGHGDSSWYEDAAYIPARLAADVAASVAAWTDRPQLVVGHSLGGLTAAALAAGAPEAAAALVVVDITPGIDPSAGPQILREFFAGPTDWASRDELVERAMAFGLGGSLEETVRGVALNTRVREDGRVEWKHHLARLLNQPREGGDDALRAALSASGWEDLARVTAPITLIRGDAGFVPEADAATFHERLPEARIVTVPSHHNVQEEAPVRLAELLRESLPAD